MSPSNPSPQLAAAASQHGNLAALARCELFDIRFTLSSFMQSYQSIAIIDDADELVTNRRDTGSLPMDLLRELALRRPLRYPRVFKRMDLEAKICDGRVSDYRGTGILIEAKHGVVSLYEAEERERWGEGQDGVVRCLKDWAQRQ